MSLSGLLCRGNKKHKVYRQEALSSETDPGSAEALCPKYARAAFLAFVTRAKLEAVLEFLTFPNIH